MTQSVYAGVIPNGSGAAVRGNINAVDQSIITDHAGSSAPNPTYPYMRWQDTSVNILYRRNATNTGWNIIENYGATTNPDEDNDTTEGYIKGSIWINTTLNFIWICSDNADGAAVWRTINNNSVINVQDYGALDDDSTNNDAAFADALAAMPAAGGSMYFPCRNTGKYRVSNTFELSKPGLYFGDGRASVIKTTHATNNVFEITTIGVEVSKLSFSSSVTRTGGTYVEVSGSDFRLTDFYMDNFYNGVHIPSDTQVIITVEGGYVWNCVDNGTFAIIESGFDISFRDIIFNTEHNPFAGFYITNAGDITVEDCNIIHGTNDIIIAPGTDQVVTSFWANNCFFDTATRGIFIAPSSNGVVGRCIFDETWFSSHSNSGCTISTADSATVEGIDFVNCHAFLNGGNGISIESANVSNITVIGGEYAQNTGSGIGTTVAGVDDLKVIGATCGATGKLSGNAYGIFHSGGARFKSIGTTLVGNTTSPMALGTMTASSVIANDGFVTKNKGASVITSGNTSVTVSHGLSYTPTAVDIMVTRGSGSGLSSQFWTSNFTSTTFDINVDVNPGGTISFYWQASVLDA